MIDRSKKVLEFGLFGAGALVLGIAAFLLSLVQSQESEWRAFFLVGTFFAVLTGIGFLLVALALFVLEDHEPSKTKMWLSVSRSFAVAALIAGLVWIRFVQLDRLFRSCEYDCPSSTEIWLKLLSPAGFFLFATIALLALVFGFLSLISNRAASKDWPDSRLYGIWGILWMAFAVILASPWWAAAHRVPSAPNFVVGVSFVFGVIGIGFILMALIGKSPNYAGWSEARGLFVVSVVLLFLAGACGVLLLQALGTVENEYFQILLFEYRDLPIFTGVVLVILSILALRSARRSLINERAVFQIRYGSLRVKPGDRETYKGELTRSVKLSRLRHAVVFVLVTLSASVIYLVDILSPQQRLVSSLCILTFLVAYWSSRPVERPRSRFVGVVYPQPTYECPTWVAPELQNYYSTCLACNRPLTDPASVARGYGPTCTQRHGIAPQFRPNPEWAGFVERLTKWQSDYETLLTTNWEPANSAAKRESAVAFRAELGKWEAGQTGVSAAIRRTVFALSTLLIVGTSILLVLLSGSG